MQTVKHIKYISYIICRVMYITLHYTHIIIYVTSYMCYMLYIIVYFTAHNQIYYNIYYIYKCAHICTIHMQMHILCICVCYSMIHNTI